MMWYYGPYGWGGAFGGMLTFLFWAIIILLLVRLVFGIGGGRFRHRNWENPDSGPRNTAMNILNERYAKGEINKEEYEIKKKDIQGTGGAGV